MLHEMMQRSTKPRGYVLVMTLLLLALAAVALAGVTAESHRRAIEALTAQDNLQQRWGAISCHQALLPLAADILESARNQADKPPSRVNARVLLGGVGFRLVFADEQAKANISLLTQRLNGPLLRETINSLIGPGATFSLSPSPGIPLEESSPSPPPTPTPTPAAKPGPATTQSTETPILQTFFTYGQVFGGAAPSMLMGGDRFGGMADQLTCWGDAKLNVTAASPAAVAAVAATVLEKDEMLRFHRAQEKTPLKKWTDLFKEVNILPDKVALMRKRVTDKSACHSLWVASDGRVKSRYRFAVMSGEKKQSVVFEY